MEETATHLNTSPYLSASILSKILFWWLNPILRIGHKKKLDVSDLYNVAPSETSATVCQKLERDWEKQLQKAKKDDQRETKLRKAKENGRPSLWRALIRKHGKQFILYGAIMFVSDSLRIVNPLILSSFLEYFSVEPGISQKEAYMYALAMALTTMGSIFCTHIGLFLCQREAMRARIGVSSLVYKKCCRLNNNALQASTTGKVINLLSNDVLRFDMAGIFLASLWISPPMAILSFALLWWKLGPQSLGGFLFIVLLAIVESCIGKQFAKLRRNIATHTDQRVRVMHEILTGIRIIKMYCWEKPFEALIKKVRGQEVRNIRMAGAAQAFNWACSFPADKMVMFCTLIPYILAGNSLVAKDAFFAMAIYIRLRYQLVFLFPFTVRCLAECFTTIERFQEFLQLEELDRENCLSESSAKPSINPEDAVTVHNVTASWHDSPHLLTLENINIQVKTRELLAVIGPVASGKTSLLMALLGELHCSEGNLSVNGKIAYVSQEPWIFSASIRQNILFGLDYDDQKYQQVIKATALKNDLEIMPAGDLTLVGDRGVTLSGGQKARIGLARAVYFDAEIYLLDNPLSAVDIAVSTHIFNKCICGLLKNKTRVLVTHHLEFLTAVDNILILKQGQIQDSGTYEKLSKSGVDFTSLINKTETKTIAGDIQMDKIEITSPPRLKQTQSAATFSRQDKKIKKYISKSLQGGLNSSSSLEFFDQNQSLLSQSEKDINETHSDDDGRLELLNTSLLSLHSADVDFEPEFVPPQMEEEGRSTGSISTSLYLKYFRAGAGVVGVILTAFICALTQTAYVMCDWWLSHWTKLEEESLKSLHQMAELRLNNTQSNISVHQVDESLNMAIYGGAVFGVFLLALLTTNMFMCFLISTAHTLHRRMFKSVINSPMRFFDTNPAGRVLNRFSQDLGKLDEFLPGAMYHFASGAMQLLAAVITTVVINPWVLLPTVALGAVFVYLRLYYLQTSRDVARLEATARSPMFSHVSASLQGVHTIRAFKMQSVVATQFYGHQDKHTEASLMLLAADRWFALRLDFVCSLYTISVCFLAVFVGQSLSAGLVGLSVTYALTLLMMFQVTIVNSAKAEKDMVAVERIDEYTRLPQEAAVESSGTSPPPYDWPDQGVVTAEDVSLRYYKDGPVVLKQLNFTIRSAEKVGIVGRTGAGKSSLIALLFRLAEPDGVISIDRINIKDIKLQELRAKISIIPQDPMLFLGTVRRNLDPFQMHKDVEIWAALDQVQMRSAVDHLEAGGLDAEICEGGANLSVGQRQLLCLARAILRNNKLLILDEATANVDPRTDELIQKSVRHRFQDCTVLTIAHRLHTVMDSDRVMVLEDGEIVEFDEPYTLLGDANSFLYKMVMQAGTDEAKRLRSIAEEVHLERRRTPTQ